MESPSLGFEFTMDICGNCGRLGDIISFPCGHLICTGCYLTFWKDVIGNLNKILQTDYRKLNGRAGSIGCIRHCPEAFVSIPPAWLEKLFLNYKYELESKTVNFLSTFLSGLPINIYKCQKCLSLHANHSKEECNSKKFYPIN